MTEIQLIESCLRQERAAQRLLYDRYKTAMYTLAYRITGDFDDANTALQDTFLTVFRQIHQFRGNATLGAWIKAILIRKAYQQLKKAKPFMIVEELPEDIATTDDMYDQIDGNHLEKMILSLSQGARTVFVLAEVEGYSHQEIADILQISIGTSKSQLNYAKKRLRAMISDER